MQIGIIGTGALGGLFAGYLVANGEDVRCFDRDSDIIDAITEDGLRVSRPVEEDLTVYLPASTSPDVLDGVDVAFVLTKSIDTGQALEDAKPALDPETTIVTVQNGLRNMEIVDRHVPSENVLGGYTRMGRTRSVPVTSGR